MGFSRQEYWSGLPFLPSGDFPDPGIGLESPVPPALVAHSLPWCHQESTYWGGGVLNFYCNALSNPIPPGCQKFNHSQYYISFLQSLPSFRGIVRRSQRWDSSNNCPHSHPLRCSSFIPRGHQPWCSLAGAKSFLSRPRSSRSGSSLCYVCAVLRHEEVFLLLLHPPKR